MFPGLLPPIPNLQVGYIYNFGQNVRTGRFTADYLLPVSLSKDSTLFGEAHTEFQSFWKTNHGFNNRVDVSLGGGYRTILSKSTLMGVNGFYDTSRLGETWYSSGSLGFELAALLSGSDALDLNFNWYGRLFESSVIRNAFRYGPSNFDVQAGYSHELWNGGPDLRLKMTGYQFDIGDRVYGWNAGAELKSRDGMFVLRYDVGNDRINQTYHTLGGFVNVGFQLDNLMKGESPFTMPEPIFKSPRNLWRMLTQNVNRNWFQPEAVVCARNAPASGSSSSSPTGAPWFRFTLSGPMGASLIRSHSWGKTDTYIYVTPHGPTCAITIHASTFSIKIEGDESSGPTNVRMSVTSDGSAPGGCRNAALATPGGTITPGSYAVTFPVPTGGLTYSAGTSTFGAHYAVPCGCGAPITPDAEAGTMLLEDLAGIVPSQTIHIITVP